MLLSRSLLRPRALRLLPPPPSSPFSTPASPSPVPAAPAAQPLHAPSPAGLANSTFRNEPAPDADGKRLPPPDSDSR